MSSPFDTTAGLSKDERDKFVAMVDYVIKQNQYSPEIAADLRNSALFVIDVADSMDDARNRMTERLKKADEKARVAWLYSTFTQDGKSPFGYVVEQLIAVGHSVNSIIGKFLAPFGNADGEVPSKLETAVHNLIGRAFAPESLESIVPDRLVLQLFEASNKTVACAQIVRWIELYLVANLNFRSGGYYSTTEDEIPHVINFFWSGRPISPGALANVLTWAKRADNTSWVIYMWSDLEISDWSTGKAGEKLAAAGVNILEARDHVDPRFIPAYKLARLHNLAGASDLFRLSLLRIDKFAGMYVDVDIAPGTIDLKVLSRRASPLSVPLFGPMVRDVKGVRSVLHLPDNKPVTDEDVRKAVAIQTRLGNINNNFIVAQPRCMFLDPIINFIAGELGAYGEDFWRSAGSFVAGVTGPGPIMGVLAKMVAIRDNLNPGQADEYLKANYVCGWPLAWLTPDSEDQDWSPEQKQSRK